MNVNQCTIVSNTATTSFGGGGINVQPGSSLILSNCIIAGNTAPADANLAGPFTAIGANLTNGDPSLAALANYGGPTPSMLPLLGSPAIDGCIAGAGFTTDQRGFPRIIGQFADIGSVETAYPNNHSFGNALVLNGSQYISVTNFGASVPTNEITVEFWAYANGLAPQSAFILQPDVTFARFQSHIDYFDGNTYWDFGNINGAGRISAPNPPNTVSNWVHYSLVASQSGNYLRIYVNGSLYASQTVMTPFTPGNYELRIGGEPGSLFKGRLDDFRIWNYARNESQILADMNTPLTGNEPGLLVYYSFDDFTTNALINNAATGAAYNGVAINNPIYQTATEPFSTDVVPPRCTSPRPSPAAVTAATCLPI